MAPPPALSRRSKGAPGKATRAAPRRLARAAPLFAALGDETRLALLSRLCASGPLSITRLSSGSDVTRQAIAKHLNVLADVGLVRGVRRGRERIWALEPQRVEEARQWLEVISKGWDDAILRLKEFVEG